MATIKGQVFGDVSGKLGGTVFSRGSGKKMLRARVQPTDAKSPAQIQNRATFSNAAGIWNSFTSLVKRQWNSYAASYFRSKTHKKGSKASGFQAAASSNFALQLANSHFFTPTFTPTTINATTLQLPPNIVLPPSSRFSSLCTNTAGDSISLFPSNAILHMDGGVLNIRLSTNADVFGAGFEFKNPGADEPFSLSFYASKSNVDNAVGQVGKGVYYLGNTGSIETVTGADAESNLDFTFSSITNYLNTLKNVFNVGDKAYCHVYAVSKSGQFSKIGVTELAIHS